MSNLWKLRSAVRVHEFRFNFCGQSEASSGLRAFIKNNYSAIKAANPTLPILVRECTNLAPTITARFDFGREHPIQVPNVPEAEICKIFENLFEATSASEKK